MDVGGIENGGWGFGLGEGAGYQRGEGGEDEQAHVAYTPHRWKKLRDPGSILLGFTDLSR